MNVNLHEPKAVKLFASKKVKLQLMLLMITLLFSVRMSAQNELDTLKEKTNILNDKVNGIDERLLETESSVKGLKKIKVSGYVQAQYLRSENPTVFPRDNFQLRRVRVKFAYDAGESLRFVVQPDLIPEGFSLKDAYAQINEPWLKTFSLWAGQFNRPNYEVEYSSGQREVPERSRVILALYPKERELGFKLEAHPTNIPLKVQLALLNGNNGQTYKDVTGSNINPTGKDFDNFKDWMLRATYSLKLGSYGGLDIGAHTYMGQVKANTTKLIKSDFTFDKDVNIADPIRKSWVGLEFQFFADLLGGMSIKGEYLTGINAMPGFIGTATVKTTDISSALNNDTLITTTTIKNVTTNTITPAQVKNFSGYYIYLVKNIGKKNQLAFRYDVYDPNTKLSGNDIGVKKYDATPADVVASTIPVTVINGTNKNITSTTTTTKNPIVLKSGSGDVKYSTLTFAWQHYFDDNIRITLAYEMPMNEKVGKNAQGVGNVLNTVAVNNINQMNDYSSVFSQNTLTLRVQVKF